MITIHKFQNGTRARLTHGVFFSPATIRDVWGWRRKSGRVGVTLMDSWGNYAYVIGVTNPVRWLHDHGFGNCEIVESEK